MSRIVQYLSRGASRPRSSLIGLGFLVLLVAPLLLDTSDRSLLTLMLIFGMFAMGFDLLLGYTGVVSFGHGAYFGLGAYTILLAVKHLQLDSIPLLLVLAVVLPMAFGTFVAAISSRSKEVYFAIITLAAAEIVHILVFNLEFTGGSDGESFTVPPLVLGHESLSVSLYDPIPLYYLVLLVLAGLFLFLYTLLNSSLGAVFIGLRENQERLEYLGYNERYYRITSFAISAGVAGMAGGLFAIWNSFVSPPVTAFIVHGEVIVYTIVGGVGTLVGPIIGAGLVVALSNLASTYTSATPAIVGALFIAVVIFMPGGLVGGIQRSIHWARDRIG